MKEHPILFSGPMVRAILEGKKTQTRRIVPVDHSLELGWQGFSADYGHRAFAEFGDRKKPTLVLGRYGWIGSKLWVRESWYPNEGAPWYQADFTQRYEAWERDTPTGILRLEDAWRPSIHMPREVSRITLEVGSEFAIRVERLQEISEEDAVAEGIAPNWCGPLTEGNDGLGGAGWKAELHGYQPHDITEDGTVPGCDPYDDCWSAKRCYQRLWNSINLPPKPVLEKGKIVRYESYPWSAQDFDVAFPGIRELGAFRGKPLTVIPNPWVWVIEFQKVEAAS